MLNLACTDRPDVAFLPGGYYYLVGDSASGKTWLTLGCLAEASINPNFDKYRLIYDDVEDGALMDVEKYFGKELARRLEPPRVSKKGRPIYSDEVEDFYYHIDDALEVGKPFIYILDSQDGLNSNAQRRKFEEQKAAARKGKEAAGSYGDGKAKYHSEHLRQVVGELRHTGSILIITGQTRDNVSRIGFDKKTRSGGKSLRFYAHLEIWTSVHHKIKQRILGKERTVGNECLAEVRKNRVTGKIGKDRAVTLPIYPGLGIDDIGSCVGFLIDEGHWSKVKQPKQSGDEDRQDRAKPIYEAKEVLLKGTLEQIIAAIEEDGLEDKVRETAGKVWAEIEAQCVPQRKKRYE
jgi:hypothetical protein